jgi:nitronate monooxygenase
MGCRYPIIQAPMAGGPSTTAMAAAAIKAGCIGSIAATGLTPSALRTAIRAIYAECGGPQVPLMVNVQLAPASEDLLLSGSQWADRLNNAIRTEAALASTAYDILEGRMDNFLMESTSAAELQQHLAIRVQQHRNEGELAAGIPASSFEEWESMRNQVFNAHADWVKMTEGVIEVVLEEKPRAFSWVFGASPGEEAIRKLKEKGIRLIGAATTLKEYEDSINTVAGLDAIVLQGNEAGGHRASHAAPDLSNPASSPFIEDWKPAEALLREISDAQRLLPIGKGPFLLSAGGVMTPDQLCTRLALKNHNGEPLVAGVLLGTALLTAADAGTSQVHREALRSPHGFDQVGSTTSFSGRWAKGLRNVNFSLFEKSPMDDANPNPLDVLPFPFQNILTAKRRKMIGSVRFKVADAADDSVESKRALAAAQLTSCWCGSGWNALKDPSYQHSTTDILRRFTEALQRVE